MDVPQGPTSFSTYDFPSYIRGVNVVADYPAKREGVDYPWPVNLSGTDPSAPFQTRTDTGLIGPSGIRIFDVTSDGTDLGLDVMVSTSIGPYSMLATGPVRIVVVRVN
jgi:hypothetical protein